jgi:hypothetical protein
MKTVAAHFDGKQIVLEEPVKLTAHTKLKVIVAEERETFSDDDLSRWFLRLSEPAFAKVWDNPRDADYDRPKGFNPPAIGCLAHGRCGCTGTRPAHLA